MSFIQTLNTQTTYISCTLGQNGLVEGMKPFHYKNILDVSSTKNDTKIYRNGQQM